MGALGTSQGSLAVAIAALLVVLGFRLARPERGREWLAVAAYAAALAVQVFGAHGLLPGRALAPPLAIRLAGAALLLAGVLVAGGPARARRRAAMARAASAPSPTETATATSTSTPVYGGLALVVLGQLLRGPSAAGAIATAVAAVACGLAAFAFRAPRPRRGPGSPPSGRAGDSAQGTRPPGA